MGACGQLKFLTLADLFRLAHELGLWEFALKVAMAYKAGSLKIPKGLSTPQQPTAPLQDLPTEGYCHSHSSNNSSAPMQQEREKGDSRLPRTSKRRLQPMGKSTDSGSSNRRSRSQQSGEVDESPLGERSVSSTEIVRGAIGGRQRMHDD